MANVKYQSSVFISGTTFCNISVKSDILLLNHLSFSLHQK
uniref:Uncharacterized protein n=1 Tax=Anguilla anguilla TaxID=7936 RepID=A0A0E9TXQ7_ANGAN